MLVIRKLAVVADRQLDCGKEIKSPLTISKERPSDVNTLCPGISAYADLSSEKKNKGKVLTYAVQEVFNTAAY